MITYNYNHGAFTFKSLNFNYKSIEIEIPIKYYDIHGNGKDCKGYANIFENVRRRVDKKFSEIENSSIIRFIEQISPIEVNNANDHMMIFKSKQLEINNYIELFGERIIKYKSDVFDNEITDSFGKNDQTKSITEKEMSDELDKDYFFNPDLVKTNISNLIIIDDTLNKGRTLNQFLIRLADCNRISSETKISLFVIYVFPEVQRFSTEKINELLSDNSESEEVTK